MKMKRIYLLLVYLCAACGTSSNEPIPTESCNNVTCSGHGTCFNVSGVAICDCDDGYHVENNTDCIKNADSDPCQGVECSSHGSCLPFEGRPTCDCDDGYHDEGTNCVADVDVCADITCFGHGTCRNDAGSAVCDCDPGFVAQGTTCIEDSSDVCDGITCSDHGTCRNDAGSAVCDCNPGFVAQGTTCIEDSSDVCDGISCSGHGTCQDEAGSPDCVCDPGYIANGTDCIAEEPTVRFTRHTVEAQAPGPAYVVLDDLNGDGKMELVLSSLGDFSPPMMNGELSIYSWGQNLNEWTKQTPLIARSDGVKFPNQPYLFDVDLDGDLDIIQPTGFIPCGNCGGLLWFENQPTGENQQISWKKHEIVPVGDALFFHGIQLVDIDSDGILDLVTTGERKRNILKDRAQAQWYKGNTSETRFESTPRIIGNGLGSFPTVIDVDNDGDLDIASAEFFVEGSSFAWFERLADPSQDNPAGVWQRHVIDDTSGPSIQLSFVENLFGDGVTRAVGANHTNTQDGQPWESALFVFDIPQDPTTSWTKHQISTGMVSRPSEGVNFMGAPGIFGTGDIDGDSDIDILVSGDGDPNIYWLEQKGPYEFVTHILEQDHGQAGGMRIVDINGDGKNELVVTCWEKSVLYVYERI